MRIFSSRDLICPRPCLVPAMLSKWRGTTLRKFLYEFLNTSCLMLGNSIDLRARRIKRAFDASVKRKTLAEEAQNYEPFEVSFFFQRYSPKADPNRFFISSNCLASSSKRIWSALSVLFLMLNLVGDL